MKTRTVALSLILTVCLSQVHCIRNKIAGPQETVSPKLLKRENVKPTSDNPGYTRYYFYQNNKQSKTETYIGTDLIETRNSYYNEVGRLSILERFYFDSKYYDYDTFTSLSKYTYHTERNMYSIQEEVRRTDGSIKFIRDYTITTDSLNQPIVEEFRYPGSDYHSRTEHDYDQRGNIVESRIYSNEFGINNELKSVTSIEYDDHLNPSGKGNNPLKSQTINFVNYQPAGNVQEIQYKYKYGYWGQPVISTSTEVLVTGDTLCSEVEFEYYESCCINQ